MSVTLERFLVLSGKGNRRHCSYLIRHKEVTVNGKTVTNNKTLVSHKDTIQHQGELLKMAPLQTFLLWKPPGYICQTGEKDPSALELLPAINGLGLVGRLDRESEGLILATNDGDLSHHLTSPDFHVPKIYNVKVKGAMNKDVLAELCSGLPLDGQTTRPLQGKILRKEGKQTWIQLTLTEGKKRQIRRLCQLVNTEVTRLVRIGIGVLTTAHLEEGQHRELSAEEIKQLGPRPPSPNQDVRDKAQ